MPSFVFQPSSVVSTGVLSFAAATDHNLEDENDELLVVATEPATTLFVDMMVDLQQITSEIESVKSQVRVRRQRRAATATMTTMTTMTTMKTTTMTEKETGRSPSVAADQVASSLRGATATVTGRPRRKTIATERKVKAEPETSTKVRRIVTPKASDTGAKGVATSSAAISSSATATSRRKKDEDALDCIYAELQASVGMCRYWGKKCWNLRVPKAKGGFHSLCHFHRVKANDNQRRFDYKRRGTLWRSFQPDPNYKDVSLFPGEMSSAEGNDAAAVAATTAATVNFEPFARPEPLQDQDFALLRELIDSATI